MIVINSYMENTMDKKQKQMLAVMGFIGMLLFLVIITQGSRVALSIDNNQTTKVISYGY